MISCFVPEIFKFSYYGNLVTDDVIGCASTVVWHKIKNISANNATSFPGSFFSASLGCWKKDPGCGWSRDSLWHILFHRGRVNQQFLSISTEAKESSSLTTPLKFSSVVVSFTQVRRNIFEVSLWFQFQPVFFLWEVKAFRCLISCHLNLLELSSRHIVRYIKRCFINHFAKYNSWLRQGTVIQHLSKYKIA